MEREEMKKTIALFVLMFAASAYGQTEPKPDALEAMTADGRVVILKADGSWEFKKFTRLGVTASGFAALEEGMSYANVVEILGREGEELSSSSIGDVKTIMYKWSADKGSVGANMNAMFRAGRLVSKAQYGLK